MSSEDILGMIDDAKTNEGGSSDYVKHHDRALMLIESAEASKTDFGQGERIYIDVVLKLLVSSTENAEGSIMKTRFYLPAKEMGDKEKEVKASILKGFFNSAGVTSVKDKGLKGSVSAIVGKKIKVAIGLKQDFYVNKDTNEPIKTNYPEYKFSASEEGDLYGDLNKLSQPRPMTSKRLRDYEQKLEYYNDNKGATVKDDDPFLEPGVDDDFDL